MSDTRPDNDLDPERILRARRARRGLLAIAVGFYVLLLLMCVVVFVVVFAIAR